MFSMPPREETGAAPGFVREIRNGIGRPERLKHFRLLVKTHKRGRRNLTGVEDHVEIFSMK